MDGACSGNSGVCALEVISGLTQLTRAKGLVGAAQSFYSLADQSCNGAEQLLQTVQSQSIDDDAPTPLSRIVRAQTNE